MDLDIRDEFESWAIEHSFNLSYDAKLNIYNNVYTEGAWLAFSAGYKIALTEVLNDTVETVG